MAAHGVSRKKSRVVGEPVKTLFGPWDASNYVTPILVIITIIVNIIKCHHPHLQFGDTTVLEQPICFHLEIYTSRPHLPQKPRIEPVGAAFSTQAKDTCYFYV